MTSKLRENVLPGLADPLPPVTDALYATEERVRLAETIRRLEGEIGILREALNTTRGERDAILTSRSWRLTAPLRGTISALKSLRGTSDGTSGAEAVAAPHTAVAPLPPPPHPSEIDPDYGHWVAENDTLSDAQRLAIRKAASVLSYRPVFSLILPLSTIDEAIFWLTVSSIEAQLYQDWQLIIVSGADCDPQVVSRLRDAVTRRASIVWREVAGEADAGLLINAGIAMAEGDFLSLLATPGALAEDALYRVAVHLQTQRDVDVIYSDEDWIDEHGRRQLPYFKPAWSIELALCHDLAGNLALYRRAAVAAAGGVQTGLAGGHAYELALRLAAADGGVVAHIPHVLFHRFYEEHGIAHYSPLAVSRAHAEERAIVRHFLAARGLSRVETLNGPASPLMARLRWPLPAKPPLVSFIVPTRDHADLLAQCVAGLLYRTDYPAVELIIADNESEEPATRDFLAQLTDADSRVRVLRVPGAFNYSAINNRAVREARGEIVALINNDIDVIDGSWLREMVSHACRPDVGAVGAKLLYKDGRIQHAGVVLGVGTHAGGAGVAGHFGHGASRDALGYFGQYIATREVSAVTAACMVLRREVYLNAGGLDEEHLPVSFNDVDLCLRIRAQGLRILWTPFAELYHLESVSRGADRKAEQIARAAREADYMRARWGETLDTDPFYNLNFDRRDHSFRLRYQNATAAGQAASNAAQPHELAISGSDV